MAVCWAVVVRTRHLSEEDRRLRKLLKRGNRAAASASAAPAASPGAGAAEETIKGVTPQIPDHEMIRSIGKGAYGEIWLARDIPRKLPRGQDHPPRQFPQRHSLRSRIQGSKVHPIPVPSWTGSHPACRKGRRRRILFTTSWRPVTTSMPARTSTLSATLRGTWEPTSAAVVRFARSRWSNTASNSAKPSSSSHRQDLIHRDIKPSNIIFVQGRPRSPTSAWSRNIGTEGSFGAPWLHSTGGTGYNGRHLSMGRLLYVAFRGIR